jgi:hypothetical protein
MHSRQAVVRVGADDAGVVVRRFGVETLLVPVCSGVGDLDSVYTLNAVGTFIWESMAHAVSLEQLTDNVTAEYDVDREQAGRDLETFLDELSLLGLVRLTDDRQPPSAQAGEGAGR